MEEEGADKKLTPRRSRVICLGVTGALIVTAAVVVSLSLTLTHKGRVVVFFVHGVPLKEDMNGDDKNDDVDNEYNEYDGNSDGNNENGDGYDGQRIEKNHEYWSDQQTHRQADRGRDREGQGQKHRERGGTETERDRKRQILRQRDRGG